MIYEYKKNIFILSLILILSLIYETIAIKFEWDTGNDFGSSHNFQALRYSPSSSYSVDRDSRTPVGWSGDYRVTSTYRANAWLPKAFFDSAGTIHLVWFDRRFDNEEIFYKKSSDTGKTWTEDKRLTNAIGNSRYPFLSVDEQNNLHLVWQDDRDGDYELYYVRSKDNGTTWSSEIQITSNTVRSAIPMLLFKFGTLHLVWEEWEDNGYFIYYKKSFDNGTSWTDRMQLQGPVNAEYYLYSQLVADKNYNLYLFWNDRKYGNDEINLSKSLDGGITWQESVRLTTSPANSIIPSEVKFASNKLHLTWMEEYPTTYAEIFFMRTDESGEKWLPPVQITNDNYQKWNWQPTMTIDYTGTIHLIWSRLGVGGSELYYRRSTDDGTTWTPEDRLTYTPYNSDIPWLATRNNLVYLFWAEEEQSPPGAGWRGFNIYSKFYDITPPTGKPSKPVAEYVYYGERKIKSVWTTGNVEDLESKLVAWQIQTSGDVDIYEREYYYLSTGEFPSEFYIVWGYDKGDYGKTYRLRARLKTETGRYSEWSDWSDGVLARPPLNQIIVYPNPYKSNSEKNQITFNLLSNDKAELKIYNIAGELVRTLTKDNVSTTLSWDTTNTQGEKVTSGVYIYDIRNSYGSKQGKIAVIR